MPSVAFEMRLAKIVVEKGVVLQARKFDFVRREVECLFEDAEGFLLVEQSNGQEIPQLENEAFDFL